MLFDAELSVLPFASVSIAETDTGAESVTTRKFAKPCPSVVPFPEGGLMSVCPPEIDNSTVNPKGPCGLVASYLPTCT
jgi:hypothetical protein